MAAEANVQAACERSRHFRGVSFQGPHVLGATWFRVGARLGSMLIVTDCKAKWTGPDDPPRALGRTHRIYRLKGVSPRVALSLGGSSRRILLATNFLARGTCKPAAGRDAPLRPLPERREPLISVSRDQAQRLALALPEAVEQDHHGRPSFRVAGKIFATQWDEGHMNVMLDEGGILTAVQSGPEFEEVWWGKRLAAVRVDLRRVDAKVLADLLADAWEGKAPKRLLP